MVRTFLIMLEVLNFREEETKFIPGRESVLYIIYYIGGNSKSRCKHIWGIATVSGENVL